jgi:hypothetical protein
VEQSVIASVPGHDLLTREQFSQLKRPATFTAIAGFVFSLLFITGFYLLGEVPRGSGVTDQEVIDYYSSSDADTVAIVSLYIIPFAGIAFLWFVVSLRMWISVRATRTVDVLFSNIQLASGILYLALFFTAAAAMSVNSIIKDLEHADVQPNAAREFPQYGASLFYVFAIRMGAMFVFTTMTIGRKSNIMPKWFIISGYLLGIGMLLSATFSKVMILAFPVWCMVLCIIIFYYAHRGSEKIMEKIQPDGQFSNANMVPEP